jgi:hypothetical protein
MLKVLETLGSVIQQPKNLIGSKIKDKLNKNLLSVICSFEQKARVFVTSVTVETLKVLHSYDKMLALACKVSNFKKQCCLPLKIVNYKKKSFFRYGLLNQFLSINFINFILRQPGKLDHWKSGVMHIFNLPQKAYLWGQVTAMAPRCSA